MIRSLLLTAAVSTLAIGCSNGTTRDQQQSETVSPDGMRATQTRTQMRDTPSGATVKETETRTREVVNAPTTMPDARMKDPAK